MSVPAEFHAKSFVDAVTAAEITVGIGEVGLTPPSEFQLYLQTGPKILNLRTLQERAKNNDLAQSKIRSVYWKIFLGLLPLNTEKWKDRIKRRRSEYDKLYSQHLDSLPEEEDEADLNIDNPLSNAQGTKWDKYFQDTELNRTIDLDIQRTYPEHDFFVHKWVQKKLINMLFIFCKEHPTLSYRQGMNEIIAPIFMLNVIQSTIQIILDEKKRANRKKMKQQKGTKLQTLNSKSKSKSNKNEKKKQDNKNELNNNDDNNDKNNTSSKNENENENDNEALEDININEDENNDNDDNNNDNNKSKNSSSNEEEDDNNNPSYKLDDNASDNLSVKSDDVDDILNNVSSDSNIESGNNNNNNNSDLKDDINDSFDMNIESHKLWSIVQDINFVEHDSYWMFCEVMTHMGKYFYHDDKEKGHPPIIDRCHRIQSEYLRQVDPTLGGYLKKVNIEPQLYGLRWIRLFFSREFHMRDVMVIWDSIFGVYSENVSELKKLKKEKDKNKDVIDSPKSATTNDNSNNNNSNMNQLTDFRFVDYMGVAMLMYIRHQLINQDSQQCLRRVMKYPPVEDVSQIIEKAYTIRDRIERKPKARKLAKNQGRNTYNFSDRWNKFSHSISKAMNNYADDVKKIMTKDESVFKKRLKFEHALGEKMGEILDRMQIAIHSARDDAPIMNGNSKSDQNENNNSNSNDSKADPFASVTSNNPLLDFDDLDACGVSNNGNKKEESKEEASTTQNEMQSIVSSAVSVTDDKSKMVIEEALAELKLVKDALLGNLDETQLEAWLDWSFVDGDDEPPLYGTGLPPVKMKSPKPSDSPKSTSSGISGSHRRNISSSGLLPPQQAMRAAKGTQSTTALKKGGKVASPSHPLG